MFTRLNRKFCQRSDEIGRKLPGRCRSMAKREEAHPEEESSCLFDGAVKGLFMFICHLKRPHKIPATAHTNYQPAVNHAAKRSAVRESHRVCFRAGRRPAAASDPLSSPVERRNSSTCAAERGLDIEIALGFTGNRSER